MPRPPCTARPVPTPRVLDDLAPQLARAHLDAERASLVRVRPGPTGVELGLLPLEPGVHPADALVGHVVPGRWGAAGVVAPARARSLEGAGTLDARVCVALLVSRDGHVAHHLATDDPAVPELTDVPVGRLPDLVRRSLGLATDPPEEPSAAWWRTVWLDAVVAAAAADPRGAPHPDAPLTAVLPPDLVAALVDDPSLVGDQGWARLRALAAEVAPPTDPHEAAVRSALGVHVDPSAAAWMDDGCFSRWLLAALPPVDELLALAEGLVPTDTLRAVHDVVGVRR